MEGLQPVKFRSDALGDEFEIEIRKADVVLLAQAGDDVMPSERGRAFHLMGTTKDVVPSGKLRISVYEGSARWGRDFTAIFVGNSPMISIYLASDAFHPLYELALTRSTLDVSMFVAIDPDFTLVGLENLTLLSSAAKWAEFCERC